MQVQIGITDNHRQSVATALNQVLANEVVLYQKTRNYHWNIEGSSFLELHRFYEEQYGELEEAIDDVAERIRSIGHYAQGRLADFLKSTSLLEQDYSTDRIVQMTNLLNDHETIIRELRTLVDEFTGKYKDSGSADFVTGLMEKHEKMAWMLRSYLK
ncbi:DNA starvation/stationary phase protection protein [Chitinophaga parva]|uniref:DNA starvation/stationary phase protection protein n=1 Tax=Chitinophaga parva TaxID=2169414 RepID=A0A2T7BL54_9BACT|nr:DNA starvation/stationary phase protection protein [Chitinophaga parva]PUZ28361.1 DNA starvation/stationary phase protection protein [Chitinophaga parva]